METLLFKDWDSCLHVAICATLSFMTAFIFIRISGKRTLAKLTAFDFVVTVTLGSTLSSMILGKTVLIDGAIALVIIIGLQYALAFFAQRSKTMEQVINTKPTLLFYDGQFLEEHMEREFVTREEIYAAIREFRLYRIEDVLAVVMELNGQLSVVKRSILPTGQHSLSDIDELGVDE